MTVVMQLKFILKYFKTAFKDLKVFTGLGLSHLTTSMGGWPGGQVGGWPGGWMVGDLENKANLNSSCS